MRKLFIPFFALVICSAIISCRFNNNGNISINYSEHSHYYTMKAKFSRAKTKAIERYLDDKLDTENMSFRNTRIDGQLTLDDRSTFYIKKSPGYLYIRFDKDQNSENNYYKIKSMCEGIKQVLGQ